MNRSHNSRPEKGRNLLRVVPMYTVLDLETTGLDPHFDSIIEIAAMRVEFGKIVERFDTLVNPGFALPEFITTLTGITDSDLADAPDIKTALPRAREFIGNDIVVAHNAHFDVNFMYDKSVDLGLPAFDNDFIDTLKIARSLFPDLESYSLASLADFFEVSGNDFHRAENDIDYTQEIYELMRQYCLGNNIVLTPPKRKPANSRSTPWANHPKIGDIVSQRDDFDPTNPLFGQRVVFTGVLERMPRREAAQIVADCGGINCDTVTKKTNFLVLGNNDYCSAVVNGKSTKQKKAEQYQAEGLPIRVISENVFYDMIEEGQHDTE